MPHPLSSSLHALLEKDLPPAAQITHMRQLAIEQLDTDILTEAVNLFRNQMIAVDLGTTDLVDLCGTGGDCSGSFNISTTSSFVTAAAGVLVAKHGNVSITSRSGGIDLLRALGVRIPKDAAEAQAQFSTHGLTFLFAQIFHPVFKKFIEARRELAGEGVRTIFNVLGPLLNPAHANCSVMGVFMPELVDLIAQTKLRTGQHCGYIVYGNGMDEFTLTGKNTIAQIKDNDILHYEETPENFGFATCAMKDIAGGDADENAGITLGILDGSIKDAKKDIVMLNAAMAIMAGRDHVTFSDAAALAREAIDSRRALELLQRMCT